MSVVDWIGSALGIIDKGVEIADQAVTDKDKQNELIANLEQLRIKVQEGDAYIKELETRTIPWIDGLHKMGRQILNVLTIVAVVILMLSGKTITPEAALILGGPNAVYQFIKGRGK